jgi:hypothetical protein
MKKLLTIFAMLISLTLLGASCKKGDQQANSSQITIPVKLTEKNVKKAVDAASKELNWPYAPTAAGIKQWMIGEGERHILTHMLNVSKDVNWAERKHKLCNSTTEVSFDQNTLSQLTLNSPLKGQACLMNYVDASKQDKVFIAIFLENGWEIGAATLGTDFSQAKKILDHFLNNLE